MKTKQATHNHKRAGEVVLLESTAELGKVLVLASGDEFWVKLTDLTQLGGGVMLHRTADIVSSVPHSGISLKVPPTYARRQ
jgi:hypothetical protein